MTLTFHSRSQLRLKLDKLNVFTCIIIVIFRTIIKLYMAFTLGMAVDLCIAYNFMLMRESMTVTLMQGHSGSAEETTSALNYLDKQASNNY